MKQIGWTPKNGQAVKQVFFTKKQDTIYAITPGWPGKQLVIKNIKLSKDSKVSLLGVNRDIQFSINGDDLVIITPTLNSEELPCSYAFTFKITQAELLPEK